MTPLLVMEDDRSGPIIPEIENSYKYEEQIMMGPRDVLNQYLADKSLLSSSIIKIFIILTHKK